MRLGDRGRQTKKDFGLGGMVSVNIGHDAFGDGLEYRHAAVLRGLDAAVVEHRPLIPNTLRVGQASEGGAHSVDARTTIVMIFVRCLHVVGRLLFGLRAQPLHVCVLLFALTSCKSSFSEEKAATLSSQLQKDAASQTSETRTVTQGPETITTTVEEYAHDADGSDDVSGSGPIRGGAGGGGRDTVGTSRTALAPSPPTLVKRTVIVDHRDPVVSQATLQASAATETKAEAKADSTDDLEKARAPAGLLGSLVGLWPLFLIAALALAGFIGWKLLKARLP